MSSRFAALGANVSTPFQVELLDLKTDLPIKDKDGRVAFIEVLSNDSKEAREFDKQRRAASTRRIMRSGSANSAGDDDQLEGNIAKLAHLTKKWHLVDPVAKEVIDVPCTEEAAIELYSDPDTHYIYRQVWVACIDTANFMTRSPKT